MHTDNQNYLLSRFPGKLWKSLFTIKNGSKIQYKTKQDSGNTYVKTEEHTKLHMRSILNKIVIN